MMHFLATMLGLLLGRVFQLCRAFAPTNGTAVWMLGIQPQPSNDLVAVVPLLGWIAVEHVPQWQRGPPAVVGGKLLAVFRLALARRHRGNIKALVSNAIVSNATATMPRERRLS